MRRLTYLLVFASFVSALGVVWVRHANREAMVNLYAQYERRDELNVEWRQLQLERSSLTSFSQLEDWIKTNSEIGEASENHLIFLADRASQAATGASELKSQ